MFPQQIGVILTRLEQAGFPAYAVGGCVRDTLLGRVPEDWDVTTAARPEQVSALFAGHCIPTGLRHGTVTVRQDGLSVEVTTFRADGPYSDHRRPDAVYFSDSLAEDLARRDLTVNAMAMDVRGEITDLYGGRDDLRRSRSPAPRRRPRSVRLCHARRAFRPRPRAAQQLGVHQGRRHRHDPVR